MAVFCALWGVLCCQFGCAVAVGRHGVHALREPENDIFPMGHPASQNPQLSQIVVQEAMDPSDRLAWIVETYVRPRHNSMRALWESLRNLGIAAPIDSRLFHYVIVGATSLPYTNHAEAVMLLGADPRDEDLIEAHVQGIVAMLLRGRP